MSLLKNILLPGGLGFVGSHTLIEILEKTDSKIVIIDDLSNCYEDILERVKEIVSSKLTVEFDKRVTFTQGNILNLQFLDSVFKKQSQQGNPLDGIIHFAALKSLPQSYEKPLQYYENNLVGSLNLFKMMIKYPQCCNFIFSSTAGVYGDKDNCTETDLKNPGSPYGQSKLCVQMLMASLARVHKNWKIISLRYFNPAGAHQSGLIGDEPSGPPNNLVPFIQHVILGKKPSLNIFGKDYDTPDGTCIRDYIHIVDLAEAHLLALENLGKVKEGTVEVVNLGSGKGYSVLEVVKGFQKALGQPFKYQFADRRIGDVAKLTSNVEKAAQFLRWKAKRDIDKICQDSVKFIRRCASKNK